MWLIIGASQIIARCCYDVLTATDETGNFTPRARAVYFNTLMKVCMPVVYISNLINFIQGFLLCNNGGAPITVLMCLWIVFFPVMIGTRCLHFCISLSIFFCFFVFVVKACHTRRMGEE